MATNSKILTMAAFFCAVSAACSDNSGSAVQRYTSHGTVKLYTFAERLDVDRCLSTLAPINTKGENGDEVTCWQPTNIPDFNIENLRQIDGAMSIIHDLGNETQVLLEGQLQIGDGFQGSGKRAKLILHCSIAGQLVSANDCHSHFASFLNVFKRERTYFAGVGRQETVLPEVHGSYLAP